MLKHDVLHQFLTRQMKNNSRCQPPQELELRQSDVAPNKMLEPT